jgi:hypothetical protein
MSEIKIEDILKFSEWEQLLLFGNVFREVKKHD